MPTTLGGLDFATVGKKERPLGARSHMVDPSLTASLAYALIGKMDEMLSKIHEIEQRIASLEELYAMADTEILELGATIRHEESK